MKGFPVALIVDHRDHHFVIASRSPSYVNFIHEGNSELIKFLMNRISYADHRILIIGDIGYYVLMYSLFVTFQDACRAWSD